MKIVEKGREDMRALQERLAQAQQDNTKQAHLLAVQAADSDQRAAKLAKQEVNPPFIPAPSPTPCILKPLRDIVIGCSRQAFPQRHEFTVHAFGHHELASMGMDVSLCFNWLDWLVCS